MNGKRQDITDEHPVLEPGEYGKDGDIWYACTPNGHLGNLSAHEVVEHDDGTITVSPSILVKYAGADGEQLWHGYLEHGIWREV